MPDRVEADEVATLAIAAVTPQKVMPDILYAIPRVPGVQVLDLESYLSQPRRTTGVYVFHTADSLAAWVNVHKGEGTMLMADLNVPSITAILNGPTPDHPGWSDHRAGVALVPTHDWTHWVSRDGDTGSQIRFAEHVEEGYTAIVDPPAAEMLEMAQSFEAHTTVQFRQATRLQSGERQLTYEEQTDAKAGTKGQLTVPERFTLMLRPFEGSSEYQITARLRYKIREGTLTIGYRLDRADEVLRRAFDDEVAKVEKATAMTAYRGKA